MNERTRQYVIDSSDGSCPAGRAKQSMIDKIARTNLSDDMDPGAPFGHEVPRALVIVATIPAMFIEVGAE